MNLIYKSTRNDNETATASQAILKGLANNSGLFVPTEIPKLTVPVKKLAQMSYQEVAYEVMKLFLTDFTEEELKDCINHAYDDKFDTPEIVPIVKVGDGSDYAIFLHLNARIGKMHSKSELEVAD